MAVRLFALLFLISCANASTARRVVQILDCTSNRWCRAQGTNQQGETRVILVDPKIVPGDCVCLGHHTIFRKCRSCRGIPQEEDFEGLGSLKK